MDWKNFISILSPCASTGIFTINVQTYDASPNVSFTVVASSTVGDDEITVANSIYNAFNYYIMNTASSLQYSGAPVFSDYPPLGTFYLGNTDFITSVWSQARFRLLITTNTGCYFKIGPVPTLITLAQAINLAPLIGMDFVDVNGNILNTQQIIDLMEMSSNTVVSIINNFFVVSNYLHEHTGNQDGTIRLRYGPCLDFDNPTIRRPTLLDDGLVPYLQKKSSYTLDRRLKMLTYRYDNPLFEECDPFDTKNEVRVTYRAGLMNIPTIVKEAAVAIGNLVLINTNVGELKGGSFAATFRPNAETYNEIGIKLRNFRND